MASIYLIWGLHACKWVIGDEVALDAPGERNLPANKRLHLDEALPAKRR